MSFIDRLKIVLDGRTITPWAKKLGIGNGTADRMREGIAPAAESLTILTRIERVSLSWLLEGLGRPFLVTGATSDSEAAALLAATLGDNPNLWTLHLVIDGRRCGVVLVGHGVFEREGKHLQIVTYTTVDVTTGPFGRASEAALQKAWPRLGGAQLHRVSPEDMTALMAGQMGTWKLVGEGRTHAPLLAHGTPLEPGDLRALFAYGSPARQRDEIYQSLLPPHRDDGPNAGTPHVDVDLLRRAMDGAAQGLAARGVTLPPDKVTLLVSLLYAYFEGGRPVKTEEFARFLDLLT